jgi:uncharacterized HAD superfamily protein
MLCLLQWSAIDGADSTPYAAILLDARFPTESATVNHQNEMIALLLRKHPLSVYVEEATKYLTDLKEEIRRMRKLDCDNVLQSIQELSIEASTCAVTTPNADLDQDTTDWTMEDYIKYEDYLFDCAHYLSVVNEHPAWC